MRSVLYREGVPGGAAGGTARVGASGGPLLYRIPRREGEVEYIDATTFEAAAEGVASAKTALRACLLQHEAQASALDDHWQLCCGVSAEDGAVRLLAHPVLGPGLGALPARRWMRAKAHASHATDAKFNLTDSHCVCLGGKTRAVFQYRLLAEDEPSVGRQHAAPFRR